MTKKNLIKSLSFSMIISIIVIIGYNSSYNQPFDKSIWNSDVGKQRLKMSNDLMRNHIKVGMHYSEIIKLLGEQDFVGHPIIDYENHIAYKLGRTDGILDDTWHILAVKFKDSIITDFFKSNIND